MDLGPDYEPEFESLPELLLELAHDRTVDAALARTVSKLAARPHVALVRVWFVEPGDICATCALRDECPDQTRCLHLVASAGASHAGADVDWSDLGGPLNRIPLGRRAIGSVGETGEQVVINLGERNDWWPDPDWTRRENVRWINAQPLLYEGHCLGVLAVFLRVAPVAEGAMWQRMIANHLAVTVANTRVFSELERLRHQLTLQNEYLREEVAEAQSYGDIVGQSPAIRNLIQQVDLVAPTEASVLILGESGTGKELVAREIHRRSRRSEHPLIKVNCASIPRELYESEFFGHVKGAFTGALKDRAGRFELADGGTLFLDEVGEIPLDLQSKLLRVLQEGQYERVGDERTHSVDVRIVAATNRDLRAEVAAGRFRRDLYYRLNVFPVEVTPLRQRTEDIALLAERFVGLAARKLKVRPPRLTRANVAQLQSYSWPGNVRELQNVVERAAIVADGGRLDVVLPADTVASPPSAPIRPVASSDDRIMTEVEFEQLQRENTRRALEQAGGKIYGPGGAAELLGIRPTTLASRIKKLGLTKSR